MCSSDLAARGVAIGETANAANAERLGESEREHPVALRHLVDVVTPTDRGSLRSAPEGVEASTRTGHAARAFSVPAVGFGAGGGAA